MPSTAPARIAQVAIPVHDLDRAKAFYAGLGLTHLFDAPPALAFFQCGETRLMLSGPAAQGNAQGAILYYGVDDVFGAYRALADKGAAFEEEPHQVGEVDGRAIWMAVGRDSEGNYMGLISG